MYVISNWLLVCCLGLYQFIFHELSSKYSEKSARTILQKSYDTPSTQLFTQLKWMSFKNRCNYHTGVLVYKALNHLTPSYITELLESASFNSIRLRSSYQYKLSYASLKTPKTNYMLSTFSKRGRDIWNIIPIEIKQTKSLNSFKFLFKKYLLQIQSG